MKKVFQKQNNYTQKDVDYLVEHYSLDKDFATLFSSRGVTSANAEGFFNAGKSFHSPSDMLNMNESVKKIKSVMCNDGKILIYGDYDADGLTASSILKLFFMNNGVQCDVVVPTRDEGYGMHIENVYDAFARQHYDLIITVDCGISNWEEIDVLLSKLDTTIIVTDHHEIPPRLPNCLCVNPKLGYPYAYLSGAGVAFKLVQALAGNRGALPYSDLAMVGTIADMMPMNDENRDIVTLGLTHFKHKGLQKLAQLSNCNKNISASDIALKIAPKINAAGRLGDPSLALDLLLMQDEIDIDKINRLIKVNEERKDLVENMVSEAQAKLNNNQATDDCLIFLYDDNWKNGVLGIVANRFREAYGLPSVFMTKDGDNYVGSARGVEGLDLFELFSSVSEYLVKFGGHKASVGFTVSSDKLLNLKSALVSQLKEKQIVKSNNIVHYDLDFDIKYLVKENFEIFKKLEPLLPNDKVTFYTKNFSKVVSLFGSDKNHLRLYLNNGLELKGFFKYYDYFDALNSGAECEIIFTLDYDSYSKRVVGVISQIQLLNSLHFDQIYVSNLVKRLKATKLKADKSTVENLLNRNSTLAIFSSYGEYELYQNEFDFAGFTESFFAQNSYINKSVLISPCNDDIFDRYANVVVFGEYNGLCATYRTNATYYTVESQLPSYFNIGVDRELCSKVYKALLKNIKAFDLRTLYHKLSLVDINYTQFQVACRIFCDLDLLKFYDKPFGYELISSGEKQLTDSIYFRLFNRLD